MREAVVLIHGVWMVGLELTALRRRLQTCGYYCYQFHYHSLLRSPQQNAWYLNAFLESIEADVIHLVAHSLGGIIILHLFEQVPTQKPGRVVMLGTPLNGSEVARRIYRFPLTRPLLGRSLDRGLLGNVPPWHGDRKLVMIAGNRGVGIAATVFGGLDRPNDGTVALSETRSEMIHIHLEVPYSHLGMLFSSKVADAICHFLRNGRF
jgi:pimeloyl-ACP methyl ester carboxylesterase